MNEKHPNITITIEEHLESYGKYDNSTKRHKRLWHAWAHNKGWLERLLQWTLNSFPGYSMHDASHAESVLHNIEMLLGESGIKQLSASDCFLILHTVYIHDIGMCITDSKRKEIMQEKEFVRYLRGSHFDKKLLQYAQELLDRSGMPKPDGTDEEDHDIKVLMKKLAVYHAVLHFLAEYKRKTHAKDSKEVLAKWVLDDTKLGAGFSTSGIPLRFFLQIAYCAGVHNSSNFQDIMDLDKVDDGYVNDYVHPRFAAVLLQLGDTLDLDNDRFHPFIQLFMEDIPDTNYIHIGKHKSIRQLWISPKRITIRSDCENPNELRLVQREWEALQNILKNAKSEWIEIRPMDSDIMLPELKSLKLYLKGREIAAEFANMRFEIQQDKAFRLLQGGNFYKDRQVVFLREIFQNAVDATKLQMWKEWKNGLWNGEENGEEARKYLSDTLPKRFPIEISFKTAILYKDKNKPDIVKKMPLSTKQKERLASGNGIFGVLVKVRDYGVGISSEDLKEIAKKGTSKDRHDRIIDSMPEWMKPTAEFGIGLQSIFLITNHFTARTHVRHGEKFQIDFSATGDKGDGRINVIPLDEEEVFQYGTEVSVFLPLGERGQFMDEKDSWSGYDPFAGDWIDAERVVSPDYAMKTSWEMIYRMTDYLFRSIKDPIVPVYITISGFDTDKEYYLHMLLKKQYDNEWTDDNHHLKGRDDSIVRALKPQNWGEDNVSVKDEYIFELEKCWYRINFKRGRLVVRNKERDVYACFSSANILKLHALAQNSQRLPEKVLTKVYYKGVYVTSLHFDGDMNQLEYIDIKGGMDGKYLALNRADFTETGKQYIKYVIYPKIIEVLRICIGHMQMRVEDGAYLLKKEGERLISDIEEAKRKLSTKTLITTEAVTDINEEMHRRIVFFGFLRAFFDLQKRRSYYSREGGNESETIEIEWNEAFKGIIKELNELDDDMKKNKIAFYNSSMYKIAAFDIEKKQYISCNILEVINCSADRYRNNSSDNYGYAIVAYRDYYLDQWKEYLLRIPENDMYELREGIDRLRVYSEQTGEESFKENGRNCEVEDCLKNFYDCFSEYVVGHTQENEESAINNGKVYSILLWVLDHMPSMAIFSECKEDNDPSACYDRDLVRREDCRINILDTKQSDSIYFADQLKMDVFDRMRKKYCEEKCVRFATYTSTSFCQLGVNNLPSDVRLVMRGRLGKIGCRRMIVPITGPVISKLFEKKQNLDWMNSVSLLEEINVKIEAEKESSQIDLKENLKKRIIRIMESNLSAVSADEMSSWDEKRIFEVADYVVKEESIELELNDKIFKFCIQKIKDLADKREEKELIRYYSLPVKEEERENASKVKGQLIQFVYDNRYITEMDKKQIEGYYELYIRDMLRIINEKISWRKCLNERTKEIREKMQMEELFS